MNREINQEFPPIGENIEKAEGNAPYISPTPGEFPIVACSPFAKEKLKNDASKLTVADIQEVVDCGFKAGMETTSRAQLNNILSVIASSLIPGTFKYIAGNWRLKDSNYKQFVNQYKNSSVIGGWNYLDEPLWGEFDEVAEQYNKLREADPNHLVYINLLGGTDVVPYSVYINDFQKEVKPGLWSYDLYPIRINSAEVVSVMYKIFYRDLHLMSAMANKTQRPFWAYVQSMDYKKNSVPQCPAPKEEYMRYEAFSALAFGAQGIVYWAYAQDYNTTENTFLTALVDLNGKKTQYWYYAQTVNREIRKFSSVFYGCQLMKYAHTGDLGKDAWDVVPPVSIADFGPVERASAIAPDKGAIFTWLRNNNTDYLVIVNHSPLESSRIDIQFSAAYNTYNLTNCNKADFSDAQKQLTLPFTMVLQPGQYRIYKFS